MQQEQQGSAAIWSADSRAHLHDGSSSEALLAQLTDAQAEIEFVRPSFCAHVTSAASALRACAGVPVLADWPRHTCLLHMCLRRGAAAAPAQPALGAYLIPHARSCWAALKPGVQVLDAAQLVRLTHWTCALNLRMVGRLNPTQHKQPNQHFAGLLAQQAEAPRALIRGVCMAGHAGLLCMLKGGCCRCTLCGYWLRIWPPQHT